MDPMTVLSLIVDLYTQLLGVTEKNKEQVKIIDELRAELEALKAGKQE